MRDRPLGPRPTGDRCDSPRALDLPVGHRSGLWFVRVEPQLADIERSTRHPVGNLQLGPVNNDFSDHGLQPIASSTYRTTVTCGGRGAGHIVRDRVVCCNGAVVSMTHRPATRDDLDAMRTLVDASIAELQRGFLTDTQVEASRAIMGVDAQLIDDGTYFVVEIDGQLAGCGGWCRRATLYGGSQTPGRGAALLDPVTDAARVRAMYTSPEFARRGVGRRILEPCEAATRRDAPPAPRRHRRPA